MEKKNKIKLLSYFDQNDRLFFKEETKKVPVIGEHIEHNGKDYTIDAGEALSDSHIKFRIKPTTFMRDTTELEPIIKGVAERLKSICKNHNKADEVINTFEIDLIQALRREGMIKR